ncbi:MAG: class I poly(R)-hydroxyalkanoic acid synthase [Alphaproteobacteria bacterium]|nr:class I poly(R)-hydroxyalkanoic acid synthase [Alphaproteobacteria bacterium]
MTIADDTPNAQQGKKLEKSLDAVAALRQAMEQRLAASKPATPPAPPPVETPPEPPKVEAKPVTPPYPPPPPPPPKAEAKPQPASPPPPPPPKQKSAPEPEPPKEETPITLDPVEWTHIMMRVGERSQQLIRDYIQRMRDKPIDTVPFTPLPMMESWTELSNRILADPEAYTEAQLALWQNYIDITRSTLLRLSGQQTGDVVLPTLGDKRFLSKDWQTNWMFDLLKQGYLTTVDEARKLVQQETGQVNNKLAKKIEFYTRLFLDATAPSNFWLTNPEVLRATLETQGDNLIRGLENLLEDLERGNGTLQIRMSDYHAFEIGKNIAATPGKVIYQNELMQLIQYAPSTSTVKRVPLLIIPPWINKYYILDLREKNSFIRYLVEQGHTVFVISWVNPTKRHALTQFEDYMDKGALSAMRHVKKACGEEDINVVGYCIGGTLLACTQAYIAGTETIDITLPKIKSATYLVTMVDFANPGDLGVFIDEDQVRMLEERMARQGYMDAGSMMMTFNLLRANDLIWPFVINNYLLGREPFPFDILYWNTDSTNLPAAMQSYYLRKMYMDNKLCEPNALKMRGVPLDLGRIETPSFLLATKDDHIAPWRSTYAGTQLYKGPVTFVLSGSGHIAGVVNPPAAQKYDYWTNAQCPENPEDWAAGAVEHKGSWWPEWVKWLTPFAGEDVPPREVKDGIEDAPGSYVRVRAV